MGERPAYLSLCEVQIDGDLVAAEPGQVVVVGELSLQLSQLLLGERCALFPGLAAGVHLKIGLLDIWREAERLFCEVWGVADMIGDILSTWQVLIGDSSTQSWSDLN